MASESDSYEGQRSDSLYLQNAEEVTSTEETRKQLKVGDTTSIRKRNVVYDASMATKRRPDYDVEELKEILEKLHFSKLDNIEKASQVNALTKRMKAVEEENTELKNEKKKYNETLCNLKKKLEELNPKLNLKIPELKSKLAKIERQKYEEVIKGKNLEAKVQFLENVNSDLSHAIKELLTDKNVLLLDLQQMQNLYRETDERSKKCDDVKAKYDAMRKELQDVTDKLNQEQDTSLHMYNMFQNERRRHLMYRCCGYCLILVVVILFAIVIIAFGYCLEDSANRNVKQCIQRVVSNIIEYFYKIYFYLHVQLFF